MAKFKKIIIILTESDECRKLHLHPQERVEVFIHSNEHASRKNCLKEASIVDRDAPIMFSEKLQTTDFDNLVKAAVSLSRNFKADIVIFTSGPLENKSSTKNSYKVRDAQKNTHILVEFR